MEALLKIQKTREYLDYLERHILNVESAWKIVQEKCKSKLFIYDDCNFLRLDESIRAHDVSKLSSAEFTQYRDRFFPVSGNADIKTQEDFTAACEHHKAFNTHHWESWVKLGSSQEKYDACIHMVVDWTAMGMQFGDTAQEYYEKNKDRIKIPDEFIPFINELFEALT